jgi:hypothetical protein
MGIAASNGQNIGMIIASVYIGVCVLIVYYAAREHFKWAKLYIIREGGILKAVRPASTFFLLAEVNEVLILRNILNVKETAGWFMKALGISRIVISLQDSPNADSQQNADDSQKDGNGKKPKHGAFNFDLMPWTKNGNQLIAALSQGIVQA